MKAYLAKRTDRGLTFFELLAVVACLCLLIAVFMPVLGVNNSRRSRLNCVSNLRQINLAFRIWEGEHGNQYPMAVSITNGGAMELVAAGNVAGCFQIMSNELSTPKLLICPLDSDHTAATNFQKDFNNSRISFFISTEASETYPQMILDGDDNLINEGVPVKPGILDVSTNVSIAWGPDRHGHVGNLGFADGSVQEVSNAGLRQAIQYSLLGTPFATNRWAIP